jgi:hypothetical protein
MTHVYVHRWGQQFTSFGLKGRRDWINEWNETRVENRRSGFSLPVAADEAFASSPQSGLAWFCFLFPLIEPDRQISRIRLSEKTHDVPCDAVCNF